MGVLDALQVAFRMNTPREHPDVLHRGEPAEALDQVPDLDGRQRGSPLVPLMPGMPPGRAPKMLPPRRTDVTMR